MYSLEDFRTLEIGIVVPEEEIDDFLCLCEDNDILWSDGQPATKFRPFAANGYDKVSFFFNYQGCGGMQYNSHGTTDTEGYEAVDFHDLAEFNSCIVVGDIMQVLVG